MLPAFCPERNNTLLTSKHLALFCEEYVFLYPKPGKCLKCIKLICTGTNISAVMCGVTGALWYFLNANHYLKYCSIWNIWTICQNNYYSINSLYRTMQWSLSVWRSTFNRMLFEHRIQPLWQHVQGGRDESENADLSHNCQWSSWCFTRKPPQPIQSAEYTELQKFSLRNTKFF